MTSQRGTRGPMVRKFNPGMLQTDDEVIRQFVGREHELQALLDLLRGNIKSPSCQHALVMGPRGSGKSMLLARVAAEIRASDDLSRALLPVRLMEESYEVFSAGDLWLDILFHLALEVEDQHPELAIELRATHSDFATRPKGPDWETQTAASVFEVADLLDRKLVLMVENMQDICEQADRQFGWKLREVMQTEPSMILIASAARRFKALDDVREPFFEIFRTLDLGPLDASECAGLWKVITGESAEERAVRPLQILTGGSPRLIAVVADARKSLADPMEIVAELVEAHTDHFRSQFEVLTGNKRRVYTALVDLWQPSSASEVARRSRRDIRGVSTVLGRLVDDGVVNIVDNGTRGRYVAADRLACVCYKLRRARNGAVAVRRMVDFMIAYYGLEWVAEEEQWDDFSTKPGDGLSSMDEVATMYDAFLPDVGSAAVTTVLKQLMRIVPVASVRSGKEAQRPIVDILLSSDARAGVLQPLIAALRTRLGDPVRASAEVMDVARDIAEDLERREHAYRIWEARRLLSSQESGSLGAAV